MAAGVKAGSTVKASEKRNCTAAKRQIHGGSGVSEDSIQRRNHGAERQKADF